MEEYAPWLAGLTVAALTVLLAGPYLRRLAWRIGLIDRPKLRGEHGEPIARSGGLTIVAALLLALLAQMGMARALDMEDAYLRDIDNVYLLLPGLVLLGLGLFDDMTAMGARVKLLVQALCALWAWVLGFQIDVIHLPGVMPLDLGLLSLPLTMVFIIAITNAFNMLDGIDGLCAGAASIALIGIGAYTVFGGALQLGLALPLAAAALAFLRMNFSRSKAFLGDSGSTFLGFVVAALALRAVRTPGGGLEIAPLFLLLSLPIVDITTVVIRRLIQGTNPLVADRGHIHHIARILFGGSVPRATFTLLAIAAAAAGGAVLAGAQPALMVAMIAAPLGLYAMVYARGGYLSLRNLAAAGEATDQAQAIAREAATDPAGALTSDRSIRLMQLLNVTAIGLLDERDELTWCLGVPDLDRDALELPMYAVGRVRRGVLYVQGPQRSVQSLAFAAQLLIPLYPAFMDMLNSRTRATRKIPKLIKA